MFRIKLGGNRVRRLWFTPDGSSVVAHDGAFHRIQLDGTARVEEVSTGGLKRVADVAPDLSAVAGVRQPRPDDDPEVGVLYTGGRWVPLADGRAGAHVVGFSPDGSRLWGRASWVVVSWDPQTGQRRQTIPVDQLYDPLVPSPDHRRLAVAADGWAVVILSAVGSGRVTLPKLPGTWLTATWSPDARWLAVGTPSGLALYDVPAGRLAQHVWGHGGSVTAVAFDPTGTRLFTGGEDEGVRQWLVDEDGLTKGPAFDWDIDGVWSVAVSADGLLCAAGGRWGQVAVWDLDG